MLAPAGLGGIPGRVTECGRPTGPGRPPARQAEVLDAVVRTVAADAAPLNLTGHTHLALRDADSARAGPFHRFGPASDT